MNVNKKRTEFPYMAVGDDRGRRVRWGDRVRIDFMAWIEDGTLIDSSLYEEPPAFTVGNHSVMPGVEQLVIGMSVGESRTEQISHDAAFGPYRPELSRRVNRSWFRAQAVEPRVGLGLDVRKTDGTLTHMIVTRIDGDQVTLDANHRYAGKDLLVQLDLLEILDEAGPGFYFTTTPQA